MADENALKFRRWRKIQGHLDTIYQAGLAELHSTDQRIHAVVDRRDELARIMDNDGLHCAFRSNLLNRYLSGAVDEMRQLQQQRNKQLVELQQRKAAVDKAGERADFHARAARQKEPVWELTTVKGRQS